MPTGFQNHDRLGRDHQGWAFVAGSRKDDVLVAKDNSIRLMMPESGKNVKPEWKERPARAAVISKRATTSCSLTEALGFRGAMHCYVGCAAVHRAALDRA
jgi:hypothetical protein